MKPPFFDGALPQTFPGDPDATGPILHTDERLRRFGMKLFIASLTMLFAASMIGYLMIRYLSPASESFVSTSPPKLLWLSTFILAICAIAITLAQRAATGNQLPSLRRALFASWTLSIAFLLVQTPAMFQLIETHRDAVANSLFQTSGLIFTLILIHALHILGGLVPLSILAYRALHRNLSAQNFGLVRSTAFYWHFLELIWVVLFTLILLVR